MKNINAGGTHIWLSDYGATFHVINYTEQFSDYVLSDDNATLKKGANLEYI